MNRNFVNKKFFPFCHNLMLYTIAYANVISLSYNILLKLMTIGLTKKSKEKGLGLIFSCGFHYANPLNKTV